MSTMGGPTIILHVTTLVVLIDDGITCHRRVGRQSYHSMPMIGLTMVLLLPNGGADTGITH